MSKTIRVNTTTGLAHCWNGSTLHEEYPEEPFPPEYDDYKCVGRLDYSTLLQYGN